MAVMAKQKAAKAVQAMKKMEDLIVIPEPIILELEEYLSWKSVMRKHALWSETRYIQQNMWNSEILTVRLNGSESCENFFLKNARF